MSADVHHLLYFSRAAILFDGNAIAHLGRQAAAFNARVGVTGLLLYDGRRFIQALEGSQAAVDEVMGRIINDRRHDSIDIFERGPASQRLFVGWSMEARHVRDSASARQFLNDIRDKLAGIENPRLISAFLGFALLGRPELRGGRDSGQRTATGD